MDIKMKNMDQMKNKPRKTVKIGKVYEISERVLQSNFQGNSCLLDLEVLVPDRPVRLLALGHMATGSAPSSIADLVEPLTAITHLVVGVSGDVEQMMAAVGEIKEKNPQLKVYYFDLKAY